MKNIELINASAGSGKTYNLTQRIIKELGHDLEPQGLMATTFTKKAAAELLERIRRALLKGNQITEAQQIFDGYIGTVNSVCSRLLQEYALYAGLSPALDVLPEDDGKRLFQIAISRVIAEKAPDMESAASRLEYTGEGSKYNKQSDWQEDVRNIVNLARANQIGDKVMRESGQNSLKSLKSLLGSPVSEDLDAKLDAAVSQVIPILELIENPMGNTKTTLQILQKYTINRRKGRTIPWSEWIRISKIKINRDVPGETLDEVIRLAGKVFYHPRLHEDLTKLISGVFDCAARSLEAYETFKKEQGLMDFVDQETQVLELARNNSPFRDSLKERLQYLMVDEFQDTSPIQLALFLSLTELAGRSVWVGDPKQAIYSFRGTDPQLMNEIIKLIPGGQTLDKSWRSRKVLVEFCNTLFSRVFFDMEEKNVSLGIPDLRKKKAEGGRLESWQLPVKNNSDEAKAIASGVRELLKNSSKIKPGDIAILCRTNNKCKDIAASLEEAGIRASTAQGTLLETRECKLALAALRYLNNEKDTVALAEIVHLSPEHSAHKNWLSSLFNHSGKTLIQWRSDPLIQGLDEARKGLKNLTPLEALELAIEKGNLINTTKSLTKTQIRMSNLDLLRGLCNKYLDLCKSRRFAATVTGFISYVRDSEHEQSEGSDDQTVQVLTYHKAKGLEWPVVILSSLDQASRTKPFGIHMVAAAEFDPKNPLSNRSIHYWPWAFGAQKKIEELENRLKDRQETILTTAQALAESKRLLYVGLTRARDRIIFAKRKKTNKNQLQTSWLDELTNAEGKQILSWPFESGDKNIQINRESFPVTVKEFVPNPDLNSSTPEDSTRFLISPPDDLPDFPPARISPSGNTEFENTPRIQVAPTKYSGPLLTVSGEPDSIHLGNAIHGFLGTDYQERSPEDQHSMAEGLLNRWKVNSHISARDLVEAGKKFQIFIDQNYPQANILKEWPVTMRNESHQLMQGWIDLLIEVPEGFVVIDHKSYFDDDPEEHIKKYAGQLSLYKMAIEKATEKKVLECLIHLPVLGLIYSLDLT